MRRFVLLALAVCALVVGAGQAAAAPGRLTKADRHHITVLMNRFVRDAVTRRNPGAAYDLVTPTLRAGSTRKQWAKGDIPVQPYNARSHGWTVKFVEGNRAGLELLLQPKRPRKIGAAIYNVDVVRIGGKWLVDSAIVTAVFAPEGQQPGMLAHNDLMPGSPALSESGDDENVPNTMPLIAAIGIGLGGLIAGTLVAIGVIAWWRARQYRRHAAGKALPPLRPQRQAPDR